MKRDLARQRGIDLIAIPDWWNGSLDRYVEEPYNCEIGKPIFPFVTLYLYLSLLSLTHNTHTQHTQHKHTHKHTQQFSGNDKTN